MDLRVGDRVRLKKQHPCGGEWWRVERAGMDFRIRCETCGHELMLPRKKLEKSIRTVDRPDADS
ncbi:DUF951 family protein [Feifania hominis]|uniref:DUF951 domain-containing protein n=1 Tax=Feifania hominis TaxID=2763660 RepID=A0A926HV18_9FIRM|nr:DUF951 domain-containing protein [Feifania hominis]